MLLAEDRLFLVVARVLAGDDDDMVGKLPLCLAPMLAKTVSNFAGLPNVREAGVGQDVCPGHLQFLKLGDFGNACEVESVDLQGRVAFGCDAKVFEACVRPMKNGRTTGFEVSYC